MTATRGSSACPHECTGKRRCVCTGWMTHTQHICNDPTCACHMPEAYGVELASDKHGTAYVPLMRRLYEENRGRAQP